MGSFGTLLRDGREHAGLTQEELAERAGVSVRTVRNLEAGKVGAPRLSSLRSLADAIGADRVAFITTARRGDEVDATPPGRLPTRLTSFVGRDTEVAAIADLLGAGACRLITITGVAGIGKTRLAIAVAERLRHGGRRVVWIALADVTTVDQAMTAVADAVGSAGAGQEAIGDALRSSPATCIVDNLEHLPDGPEVIERLLGAGPEVAVVATSRTPIGIDGEHERPLGPLALPPRPGGPASDAASLVRADAAVLLIDRIRASDPGFAIDDDKAAAIAETCHVLGGMPLALELAARQWRVRGADGLLEVLRTNPLSLADVTHSRRDDHSSVAAALRASYDLLGEDTKRALRDLATFRGGWTLEAASAVTSPDSATDVIADHDQLLASGLIEVGDELPGSGPSGRRFSMLPVVQAFAAAQATEEGATATARRHAEYFAEWAASLSLHSQRSPDKLRACDDDDDNLRAALDWLTEHAPSAGLDMAITLSWYWGRRSRDHEALARFTTLLDHNRDHPERGFASMIAAGFAHFVDDPARATRLARESLEFAEHRGDATGRMQALGTLGMLQITHDPASAVETLREAAELAATIDYARGERWALGNLVEAYLQVGLLDLVHATIDRLLADVGCTEQDTAALQCVMCGAQAQRLAGNAAAARTLIVDAGEPIRRADSSDLEVHWLSQGAIVEATLGDLDAADDRAARAIERLDRMTSRWHDEEVYLAAGEVALARGERAEATKWFRRATDAHAVHLHPMRRIESLAALATATDDRTEAAAALAAIDELRQRLGITLPPVITRRCQRARRAG